MSVTPCCFRKRLTHFRLNFSFAPFTAHRLRAGIPYALLMGGVHGIPSWWRLVDCSFGVFGAVPLSLCRRWSTEPERSAHIQSKDCYIMLMICVL